jgi:hypothetical protein
MSSAGDVLRFCAVGDVTAYHKEPETGYEFVGPVLREMDVIFGQNERHYSKRRDIHPLGGFTELTWPEHAPALKLGNYDVLAFASNHGMDLGPDVMLETVQVLRDLGFKIVGAGENLADSRKPEFVEKKGVKFGFLAYCSVLRPNCQAGETSPGIAPMRAHTYFQQVDFQPGTPPKILTFPYKDDMEGMLEDIRTAKEQCDILVVGYHWGIHAQTGTIADYQYDVAYAAIDAGADMIMGSHPHRLKAIEVYKGKPICYSLGNFVFDQPRWVLDEGRRRSPEHKAHMESQKTWKYDPDYEEWYAVPAENRKTMMMKIDIDPQRKSIERIAFLPLMINNRAQPEVLKQGDPRFDDVVTYVREITESQNISTIYRVEGDEVVVEAG